MGRLTDEKPVVETKVNIPWPRQLRDRATFITLKLALWYREWAHKMGAGA